jgi:hypothetical protein
MFGACATGSCAIFAKVGTFWPEVTKSRHWKRPCPEAVLIGSMFCAYPAFSRVFFLVLVPWLPDVTKCHLTPFGVLFVCVCATGSCATPIVVNNVGWGVLYDVRSYYHRKPRVLYLGWLLELALVICPFYFHIVSI